MVKKIKSQVLISINHQPALVSDKSNPNIRIQSEALTFGSKMVAGSNELSQVLQLFLEAVDSILKQFEVYERTQDAGMALSIVTLILTLT